MYVVIAMAGEGKRFVDSGFTQPKFQLLARDKPLFDWAVSSLRCFFEKAVFVFVVREGFDEFISDRCRSLGINSYEILSLSEKTDGQATTVLQGTERLRQDKPLLIYNIDTYIKTGTLKIDDIRDDHDGWLLLFQAPGTHWSFAKLDSGGRVIDVSEKVRISEFASTGLYYFKSIGLFRDAYFETADLIKEKYKEVYVAPIYASLIKNNKFIGSKVIEFDDVVPLGTPDEVKRFDPDFLVKYRVNSDK